MEKKKNKTVSQSAVKIVVVAVISLLLLIPLVMIKALISDRQSSKSEVEREIEHAYGTSQTIASPYISSTVIEEGTGSELNNCTDCANISYETKLDVKKLHRSIYDVIVYSSNTDMKGVFTIGKDVMNAKRNRVFLKIRDFKGLTNISQLLFGGNTYKMIKEGEYLVADVELPQNIKEGDKIDFALQVALNGTESITFYTDAEETLINISSNYEHPSFYGDFLPLERSVTSDGFKASWSISEMNIPLYAAEVGVSLVDPANSYQKTMRSAKYGILIILLVFVASLFVEFLTRKEINIVQYIVIGLSLVLFYSMLLALSEFISFGYAYLISAIMTIGALIFYFREILKNKSAYLLGLFVTLVYIMNYILLSMEIFSLLTGSLVLFVLLCVVMYLTANLNKSEGNKVESENKL